MKTSAAGVPVPLSATRGRLDELYDVALLDLDGVIYRGTQPVAGAPEALDRAAAAGMRIGYVTNNAARPAAEIADQLRSFGVILADDDVVTSAQAAADLIAAEFPTGTAVLVVGGDGLDAVLRERGLRPVSRFADQPAVVVQGFHPMVSWTLMAEGVRAIQAGAAWYATNLDLTLPTAWGIAPGNGALVNVIRTAVDIEPIPAGKPASPLLRSSIARLSATRPLLVGDRLDTDIAGAYNVGIASLWVATGVDSPAVLAVAPPGQRPTYVAAGLHGLNESHRGVVRKSGSFRCGGWQVTGQHQPPQWQLRRVGDTNTHTARLASSGPERDSIDALRAVLAACWALADAGASYDPQLLVQQWAAVERPGWS